MPDKNLKISEHLHNYLKMEATVKRTTIHDLLGAIVSAHMEENKNTKAVKDDTKTISSETD